MAPTNIADIIVPEVFNPYVLERTAELSAFVQSGIVAPVEGLNVLGFDGGQIIQMPFWTDLSGDSQDLADNIDIIVNNIGAAKDQAMLIAKGNAWGANDLAKALSGSDPMAAVGDLVAAYWAREQQRILIITLGGAMGAASMASNVLDISAVTGAGGEINGDTFVDATSKLGDAHLKTTAVAFHSATVASLKKQDLIEFIPDSEGKETITVFQGKRVIEDDGMPTNGTDYTSYLFGPGAVGFGSGAAPVPTETDRDSLGSTDILINRQHFVQHPRGIAFGATPTANLGGATETQLGDSSNWTRVWEPKNVRIVEFIHRLAP